MCSSQVPFPSTSISKTMCPRLYTYPSLSFSANKGNITSQMSKKWQGWIQGWSHEFKYSKTHFFLIKEKIIKSIREAKFHYQWLFQGQVKRNKKHISVLHQDLNKYIPIYSSRAGEHLLLLLFKDHLNMVPIICGSYKIVKLVFSEITNFVSNLWLPWQGLIKRFYGDYVPCGPDIFCPCN